MTTFLLLSAICFGSLPGADLYAQAHDDEAHGRYADAAAHYQTCAEKDPQLAPYARVRAAAARGRGGDPEGAIKALNACIQDDGDGPWVRMAQAEAARLYANRKQHAQAARLLEQVVDLPVVPRFLQTYQWELVDQLTASETTRISGYDRCARILRDADTRTEKLEAAARLAESPDMQHRLDAASAYLACGELRDAKKVLLAVAPSLLLSGETYRPQGLYLQGRLLSGGTDGAGRDALQTVSEKYPETQWARLSLKYLARDYYNAGQLDKAKAAFERLARNYPNTEETGDALWWLGQRYESSRERDAAIDAYLSVARVCPDHKLADDALLNAATLLRKQDKKEEARAAYEELAERYAYSANAAEALYEAGRLHESAGDTDKAVLDYAKAARLVGDFFAHRAMERLQELGKISAADLNVTGRSSFVRPVPIDDLPQPKFSEDMRDAGWFDRLRFFAGFGWEDAEWEALGLIPHLIATDLDPAPYYQALADNGLAAMAVDCADATGWGLKDGAPTLERLWVLYPRAYWDDVEQTARETGLDPYLLLAVGRQESIFQSRVVSRAGATGVMQLMPGTATWLAKVEPAVGPDHSQNLTHPGNSLRLGAYYLLRMIERNDANIVYALASYNAGPGNVAKWRRQIPTSDMEAFVEAIPFDETRGFVKKVLGNYAAYHSLYRDADRLAAAR